MGYRVLRSVACDHDLSLIFDHLFATYQNLGDAPDESFERPSARIRAIEDDMEAIGRMPIQGTLWPDLLSELRWVTKNRAIFYFQVDETASVVRVLAVFFGGQDHWMKMLLRLSALD
ncbi:MAG: type II toxin-antitoxin system RelE/ParE family toxin [Geminicoccaceae bacterium]